MANSLRAIASEMVRQLKGDLWREESIASLTTTTVVCSGLAVGGWSPERFTSQFLWRPDTTTTADKIRYVTNFASSTGTLTHAGTNYADTTATSEKVIISRIEPYIIRQAIDQAVQQLRQQDRTIIPVRQGTDTYWLGDMTWIRQPADIVKVCYSANPVISRNRYFQKRTGNSSGVWTPDDWTVSNNADSTPYETHTGWKNQPYVYKLQRSGGTDATMVQTISAGRTGVSGDWPSGETITAVVVADPDTAGDVLLTLTDGTTTSTSTGSGAALQEISATLTLAAAASTITITITAQTSNATQAVHEAYVMVGDLSDPVRRDSYSEQEIGWDFDQYGGLRLKAGNIGHGQIIIYSKRPYPAFDSTRLSSGAADADETDAPLQATAFGAIANILLGREGESSVEYLMWKRRFDQAAMAHLGARNRLNDVVNNGLLAAPARTLR